MIDEQHSIRTRRGDTFEIVELSNPTTGYKWTPAFDETRLELKAEKFQKSSESLGTEGKQKFTFLAKQRGRVVIQFVYKRPWEDLPLKHHDYEIIVD